MELKKLEDDIWYSATTLRVIGGIKSVYYVCLWCYNVLLIIVYGKINYLNWGIIYV